MNPKKIIVRGTNWIGDAVMTLPALAVLRTLFPYSQIDVLARTWTSPVYRYCAFVDKVFEFEQPRGLMSLGKLAGIAKKIAGKNYEQAIVLPNSFESALVFKMARIPEIFGYDTDFRSVILSKKVEVPGDKGKRHEVFYYVNLMEKLFCQEPVDWKEKLNPALTIPEDEIHQSRKRLEASGWDGVSPLIGLNPGAAYGPAKCWPVEKYQELAVSLSDAFTGSAIVVFGTEKERQIGRLICQSVGKKGINLCGVTSLDEAIAIISLLDLMVSNDSGLMHVAAACNIPLVALFGSTNPVTTGPWSKRAKVIYHRLPCSPCLRRECPRDFICMLGITVQEVIEACIDMIK